MTLDELRETPVRYWVLAALASTLVLVTSYGDVLSYLPGLLYVGGGVLAPLRTLVWLAALGFAVAPPVVACVRPWWAVASAAVWLLPLAVGTSVFAGVFVLVAVSVVATWRDRAAGLVAAVLAYVTVAVGIVGSGSLLFPFAQVFAGNTLTWYTDGWGEKLGYLLVWGLAIAVVVVLAQLLRSATLRSRAGRAAVARAGEVEEQSAVTAERARLARDLHDVVAHHVSLIAVRAETAPYTHPQLDPTARGLLAEIAQDARLALDELRGVLGILGRAAGDAERAPQPGLSDVPALVDRSRSAGAEVTLDTASMDAATPSPVQYVAYRVVQEALTNARRHAAGAPVHVSVGGNDAVLIVQVSNPAPAAPAGPSGRGLVGMRERVEAVGGHLEAGGDQGSFTVRATLPRAGR